jgi:hypothetical protein
MQGGFVRAFENQSVRAERVKERMFDYSPPPVTAAMITR